MENSKSAIELNLSNQANIYKGKRVDLSQLNSIIILGLSGLDFVGSQEGSTIPVAFTIEKTGDVSISGIDTEKLQEDEAFIHSDKKVTKSNESNY